MQARGAWSSWSQARGLLQRCPARLAKTAHVARIRRASRLAAWTWAGPGPWRARPAPNPRVIKNNYAVGQSYHGVGYCIDTQCIPDSPIPLGPRPTSTEMIPESRVSSFAYISGASATLSNHPRGSVTTVSAVRWKEGKRWGASTNHGSGLLAALSLGRNICAAWL